jgi:hypothetical protein
MSVRALGVTIFGFGALISAVLGFSEHDAANKMPTYSDPVMESRFNELRNRPSNLMQPGDDPQIFLDYISAQQASNQLLSNAEKQMHLHAESRDEYIFLFLFCCAAVGFFCLPWEKWIKTNAEISDEIYNVVDRVKEKVTEMTPDRSGARIIGRDGLKSYSSADELLKWKKLLDEGVVSYDEYDDAVGKIMRRK